MYLTVLNLTDTLFLSVRYRLTFSLEQILYLGGSMFNVHRYRICELCVFRGKIPLFPSKSVAFAADSIGFMANQG